MTDISVVGPDGGEQMLTGPVRMRILEDAGTTDLYVQYFRDLRDMIAAGQPLTLRIVGVMARYDTVPATDFAS
jgi:hypothetical protein